MLPKILAYVIITSVLSTLLTWVLITVLGQKTLDVPNERSSHAIAVPRGGGLAIFGAVILINLLIVPSLAFLQPFLPVIAGTALLMGISWFDDVRRLGPLPRFIAQVLAVVLGIVTLHGTVFHGLLPTVVDKILAGLIWLWFINLFNFMDGIDGLATGQAIFLGVGVFIFTNWGEPLIFASALLGFLFWNWGPAKIFLGDVGSIPLGYMFGAFLLWLAEAGFWAGALILPLYFLADATVTLLRRLYRGELVWEAHRQHFYQLAVQNGRSHRLVAGAVMAVNVLLVIAAISSVRYPLLSLLAAVLVVGLLLWWMVQKPGSFAPQKRR